MIFKRLFLLLISIFFFSTVTAQKKKKANQWLSNAERNTPVDLNNKGVGKIKTLTLGNTIDQKMATSGEALFNQYCSTCHKIQGRSAGPEMKGILKLRAPEWLMNMILDPDLMHDKDPIADSLLDEYTGVMTNQGLTEQQAREILEFLRTVND